MNSIKKMLFSTGLLAAGALVLVPAANATAISMATGTSSSNPCGSALTVTGSDGTYVGTGHSTHFMSITVTAIGVGASGYPPDLLNTDDIDVRSSGTGTLYVCVTETGLTGTSLQSLLSTLGTSEIPRGWTIDESTYAEGPSTSYGRADTLLSASFTNPSGTLLGSLHATDGVSSLSLSSPYSYSLTEIYEITATSSGTTFNGSMDIAEVPEPGTLALFAVGLLGTAIGLRRRRS